MDNLAKAQALDAKKEERHQHLVEICKAGKAKVQVQQQYAWWDGDYYQWYPNLFEFI